MRRTAPLVVGFTFALSLFGADAPAQSTAAHDGAFWRAIAANKYEVPANEKPFALAQELSNYLSSPDPQLRDDLAYTILTVWIVHQQQFSPHELIELYGAWIANLRRAIGETGTDSIFKRSFSALCLSSVAEREQKTPFLGEARYRQLLDSALAYLSDERDLRGFDATKGWIHATAHTAIACSAGWEHLFHQTGSDVCFECNRGAPGNG